nr:IS110 family transposase [Bradyrhizobium genosp. SA-3]
MKLVGECGTDLRARPSAKHFTSWLCLAPGNKISGSKVLSSRTRRSSSWAAALLRWQPQPLAEAIQRSAHSIMA